MVPMCNTERNHQLLSLSNTLHNCIGKESKFNSWSVNLKLRDLELFWQPFLVTVLSPHLTLPQTHLLLLVIFYLFPVNLRYGSHLFIEDQRRRRETMRNFHFLKEKSQWCLSQITWFFWSSASSLRSSLLTRGHCSSREDSLGREMLS